MLCLYSGTGSISSNELMLEKVEAALLVEGFGLCKVVCGAIGSLQFVYIMLGLGTQVI